MAVASMIHTGLKVAKAAHTAHKVWKAAGRPRIARRVNKSIGQKHQESRELQVRPVAVGMSRSNVTYIRPDKKTA